MTEATSSYLNKPPRSEAEALADHNRAGHIKRLRRLSASMLAGAARYINMSTAADARRGYEMMDDVRSIDWALLQIDPLNEGPRQMIDEIGGRLR